MQKRPGSRLLFSLSLLACVAVALFLGAAIPDLIAGFAGISSRTVRLVLKVGGVVASLPLAFYLVERMFLKRSRHDDQPAKKTP